MFGLIQFETSRTKGPILLAVIATLAAVPVSGKAEIVWSGDFDSGDFRNFHSPDDPDSIFFWLVPEYGRPGQYGNQVHTGNGELLSLDDSRTRGGNFSAKFTVKSQSGGGVETRDCDPAVGCKTRRSQLQMTSTLMDYYNAIPYGSERWISMSFYVPEDFQVSDDGWGPVVWGSKGSPQKSPGWAGIFISEEGWVFSHRFESQTMFNTVDHSEAWWLTTDYSSSYPSSTMWPDGLVDFPDESASKAALGNLNRGGWTDFVLHFQTDISEHSSNFSSRNKGFLDVYMRSDRGPWVHVLNILPMEDVSKGANWLSSSPERVFDRGIGQYAPRGYTSQIGLYMNKKAVWSNANNMVIYVDNYKIGDEHSTFESMTHDGSTLDGSSSDAARPNPPEFTAVQ